MSSNIKWKPESGKKENEEKNSSRYKDLCSPSQGDINAKEIPEMDEVIFFNRGGRKNRRRMKSQFHHHSTTTPTPLTSFSHSSTSHERKKCDSPSVCNDRNCKKERRCCCCCEFAENNHTEKTKELNNPIDHPNRKGRRRNKDLSEMTTGDNKHESGISLASIYSNLPTHAAKQDESATRIIGTNYRYQNIGSTCDMDKSERMHDFHQRRSKTNLDENMLIGNNSTSKTHRLPLSSPLTRALLLEDKVLGFDQNKLSNRNTSSFVLHHTELMISTPERKRKKMKQNPFNFDLSKDRSKTVEKGSEENATSHRTTVAVSQNLGMMMDEIKMRKKIIIDKDLDEMKEKPCLLEKDILVHAVSGVDGVHHVPSLHPGSATDNQGLENTRKDMEVQKKKTKVVAFGDKCLQENVSNFSSCLTNPSLNNQSRSINTKPFSNKDEIQHFLVFHKSKEQLRNSELKNDLEYVIRKRKSGLVAKASQVIPSDNNCLSGKVGPLKCNIPRSKNDLSSSEKTTFFGTPRTNRKLHEQSDKDNSCVVGYSNDMSFSNWKNINSKKNTSSYVKENGNEEMCPKELELSTAKIFCQPRQNVVFVENPSKSPKNSNFEQCIIEEREKGYKRGHSYHTRSDGLLFHDDINMDSSIDAYPTTPLSHDIDAYDIGFNGKKVPINSYLNKLDGNQYNGDTPKQSQQFEDATSDKRFEKKLNDTKLPTGHINASYSNYSNKHCDSPNFLCTDNKMDTSDLSCSHFTQSSDVQNYKNGKQCRNKNGFSLQNSSHEMSSQKNKEMRENIKSVDLTSDNSKILKTSPKETKERRWLTGKHYDLKPCIKSKTNPTKGTLKPQQINYHSNSVYNVLEESLGYEENIPTLRRAKTDLTLHTGQRHDDVQGDLSFSTPGCRKPINSSMSRLLESKVFSKSDNLIINKQLDERPLKYCPNRFLPQVSTGCSIYCDDVDSSSGIQCVPEKQVTRLDEKNPYTQEEMLGLDLIVHNKRRIPDGMAHMTELCTRHKHQNNIHLVKNKVTRENMRLNCYKDNAFSYKNKNKPRPKSDTFNLVFNTGN